MVRTQIQITEHQARRLKEVAAATGLSIAHLIREGIEVYLGSMALIDRQQQRQQALAVAGKFRSGKTDISTKHDRYLEEAFRK